jgi:hypothetical protein
MMRFTYFLLPAALALALPLSADARGLRGCSTCNGGRGGLFAGHGDFGGKGWFGGLFGEKGALANAPPANDPHKLGKGFFQPPFQAAPWYLYWPYDQHFQLPAPIGAPYIPPQGFNAPWNPYFAHPALGLAGGPPPYPGFGPGMGMGGPPGGGFGPGPSFGPGSNLIPPPGDHPPARPQ